MKHDLYVTDWAPNGTNDLVVVNRKTNEIKEIISQATFGIDVAKGRSALWFHEVEKHFVLDRRSNFDVQSHTFVRKISMRQLKQNLCVSPVDPNGADLIERLRDAGIRL